MRTSRPVLLASAAAVLVAGACSRDGATPAGPTIAGAPGPSLGTFYLGATAPDTTTKDSVVAGYGCNPTGGLDYQCFEYEPCTGTEYVVCPDTTPTPSPTPAPKTTSPTTGSTGSTGSTSGGTTTGGSTGGTTSPQDSVQSGYGSGSTGGIEYDRFDYDPETGTEPVVRDTTPKTGN